MIRALHALDSLAIRLPNRVVSLALSCLFNCSKQHCVGSQKVQQRQEEEDKKEGQEEEEEAQERESEGQAQERWEVCSRFLKTEAGGQRMCFLLVIQPWWRRQG